MFEKILAIILFILLLPIIIVIGLIIKFGMSDGPVIYKQRRIGQGGKPFVMYKFRTMITSTGELTISVKGDKRITPLGARLRKYKIDEVPELWNIIKGDMAFVGPRPDVPGYADNLKGKDRDILQLKPGITGPASLKYINEEEILAKVDEPGKYNNEVIFPDKVKINLKYLENKSVLHDAKIIWYTIIRKPLDEY